MKYGNKIDHKVGQNLTFKIKVNSTDDLSDDRHINRNAMMFSYITEAVLLDAKPPCSVDEHLQAANYNDF